MAGDDDGGVGDYDEAIGEGGAWGEEAEQEQGEEQAGEASGVHGDPPQRRRSVPEWLDAEEGKWFTRNCGAVGGR
jgi:hypothetical protein